MIELAKKKVRQALNWGKEKTKPIFCIAVILAIHFFGKITWFENYIQISKEVKITDIVSILVTSSIFFFGYQISKSQKNIAKEKLKLDLFDRRYKIYSTFNIALAALRRNDLDSPAFCVEEDSPHDKLDPFFTIRNCWDESRFLLDGSSFEELDKIFLDIIYLHGTIGKFKRAAFYPNDPDEKAERKELKQKYRYLIGKIEKYHRDLSKIFSKYMSFEDLKIK